MFIDMSMLLMLIAISALCVSIEPSVWGTIVNETSQLDLRDYVVPTPLILYGNRTPAIEHILETNNRFVSNTSLEEILRSNETQFLLLRYRERKRQMRIYNIQQEILQRLGISRYPNVTVHMSIEERQTLIQSYGRTLEFNSTEEHSYDNQTVLCNQTSSC